VRPVAISGLVLVAAAAAVAAVAVGCQPIPGDRVVLPVPACGGAPGIAAIGDAESLASLMRTAVVDVPRGELGFRPAGAIAVAQPQTGGAPIRHGTFDVIVVEDPLAFAESVLAGRDILYAEHTHHFIPDATTTLRIKLPGALRPDTERPFALDPDAPSLDGRPPPGVAGPILQSQRDHETGEPLVTIDCLSRVPGRVRGRFRGTVRRAFSPGENQIDVDGQTHFPTEIRFEVPLVPDNAVTPAPPSRFGVDLVARVPLAAGTYATDVWGAPSAAYVGIRTIGADAARGVGLLVVDLADAERPVATPVSGVGPALDVAAHDGIVYVASGGLSHGLFEVDARDVRAPLVVRGITAPHVHPGLHTLFVDEQASRGATDETLLYGSCLDSCDGTGLAVLAARRDASAPPREIAYHSAAELGGGETGRVHDMVAVDGRAAVANWTGGWQILDFGGPGAAPVLRASFSHSGAQAHSIWPLGDDHVATTDEYPGGHLRIWRLLASGGRGAGGTGSGGTGVEVASYRTRRSISAHNLWLDGSVLYIAYYQDGLRALDVSDPERPREVAAFPTRGPAAAAPRADPFTSIYSGAWGVWAQGQRILVSDTDGGLFVLRRQF